MCRIRAVSPWERRSGLRNPEKARAGGSVPRFIGKAFHIYARWACTYLHDAFFATING